MKHLHSLALALLVAPTIAAQTPPAAITASDYGVIATSGANTAFDSRAQGTPIGRGLVVRAVVGGGMRTPPDALAVTSVMPAASRTAGVGIQVREHGHVRSADPMGGGRAGTSNDAPGATAPGQGPHAVGVAYRVPAGTPGVVTVLWDARASAGAGVRASIDVDGDGTADWSGVAGTNDRQHLRVMAGPRGVRLHVTTAGQAGVRGLGEAGYAASLTVLYRPGTGGGGLTCTWTPSGPQCTGQLAGSDSTTPLGGLLLRFDVTAAPAGGIGVLLTGSASTQPVNIPTGPCQLLVDPSGLPPIAFLLDANGAASLRTVVRPQPVQVDFQVLTLAIGQNGLSFGSTNALNLTCQ